MKLAFFRRRVVWWPTRWGWLSLALAPLMFALSWWWGAEPFLGRNRPLAGAAVLVVEGWIGPEGLAAAKNEFVRGGYARMVASGGVNDSPWSATRSNYADMAQRELLRLGVPAEQLWVARSTATDSQRTYGMALAVRAIFAEQGLCPAAANVFTRGVHARRSRLVYAKVLGPATAVGCLAWMPAAEQARPWWNSSERSKDLINETAGYLFELLVNSGRGLRL